MIERISSPLPRVSLVKWRRKRRFGLRPRALMIVWDLSSVWRHSDLLSGRKTTSVSPLAIKPFSTTFLRGPSSGAPDSSRHMYLNAKPPCLSEQQRSEERRVGKEDVSTCKSGWSQYHKKK